jgi:hypothetical protein
MVSSAKNCFDSTSLHNVIKISAQEKNETSFFTFLASYIGVGFANISGGIKTRISYLGLISLNTYFDTSKAHLWKDGGLFLNIFNTHGGKPTTHFVGDQTVNKHVGIFSQIAGTPASKNSLVSFLRMRLDF